MWANNLERYICPQCGGRKSHEAVQCLKCFHSGLREAHELHPLYRQNLRNKDGGRQRARRWYPTRRFCETCGVAPAERHHRDGNQMNNEESNIAWLCRACHMAIDGRLTRSAARGRTMAIHTRETCVVCGASFRAKGKVRRCCSRACRKVAGYFGNRVLTRDASGRIH